MLSNKQIEEIGQKISYKPGSRISVLKAFDMNAWEIRLVSDPRPDADGIKDHWEPLIATSTFMHEAMQDESTLKFWIYKTVRQLELHEIDEWLKVDGVWIKDPHPELRLKTPKIVTI